MPTINQLAPVSQLSGGDQIPIYVPNNGDARRTSVTQLTQYVQDNITPSAENVAYAPPFTGAVPTNVEAKLAQTVSVKDFGAVGDGVTNDTTAIHAAVAYMQATGHPVYVPPGTYLTDPIQTSSQTYARQAFFYGDEYASTIVRRRTTGVSAFVTIGSPLATSFQANIVCSNVTFDGGPSTNGPCFVTYDMVRSVFTNVDFKGGSIAYHSQGGIANTFNHCFFRDALRGFVAEAFVASGTLSPAGGGWPNINRLNDCHVIDNAQRGVWFNDGRLLIVENCQIEGNGTTFAADQGGVYIGPDIGTEISITDPESIGIVINNSWLEANKGVSDIQFTSGINSVSNSNFFSQSTSVTNDIRIDGGKYQLRNLNMSFAKTANVLENSGAGVGNTIDFVQASALSFDSSKTSVNDGWRSFIGNGAVPGVNGATSPLILTGSDTTSANPTVTFTQSFKSATIPHVYCQVTNNSTGTIECPEVYSVSNTAFTIRKKSFNGTVIGTANYTVTWMAIGENP